MIDNYDAIHKAICPSDPTVDRTVFYMFQVIQRPKDGHDEQRIVKIEYGDFYNRKLMDRLKFYTETFRARTYMKVNRCYQAPIALRTMSRMAEMMVHNQYNVRKCYDSVCGSFKPATDNLWVLDIDSSDYSDGTKLNFDNIYKAQLKTGRQPIMGLINTPQGYHLITRPFHTRGFDFDKKLHKNGQTVLFSWKDQETKGLPQITLRDEEEEV